MDMIQGIPTFTFPVTLQTCDSTVNLNYIKITTPNLDFFFNSSIEMRNLIDIDLSGCGDDITIPTEFISQYPNTTIYVTPAVKENYQDYSNIVAQ